MAGGFRSLEGIPKGRIVFKTNKNTNFLIDFYH